MRDFCSRIGVAKKENVIDVALLEHTVREDLNRRAARALAVLRPLKVVIENLPDGFSRSVVGREQPRGPVGRHAAGDVRARAVHRARRLHGGPAEEVLPACRPGNEVRLRYAYIVKCTGVVKDAAGT